MATIDGRKAAIGLGVVAIIGGIIYGIKRATAAPISQLSYVSDIRFVTLDYPKNFPYVRAEVDIQNQGDATLMCNLCLCDAINTGPSFECYEPHCPVRRLSEPHLLSETLQPGEVKTFHGVLWYREGMVAVHDWWAKFSGDPGEIYGKVE